MDDKPDVVFDGREIFFDSDAVFEVICEYLDEPEREKDISTWYAYKYCVYLGWAAMSEIDELYDILSQSFTVGDA